MVDDTMGWHCSIEQIDWKARGMNTRNLEVLALKVVAKSGAASRRR